MRFPGVSRVTPAMAVFFTSDTHFGDPRGLVIDRRPFASVAAMDAELIARWNAAVGPQDEVWHLGDVMGKRALPALDGILSALNGRIRLILGNNDPAAVASHPRFASVGHYAEIEAEGRRLVLCHYPFRTWNGVYKGALNLHGHSHGRLTPLPRQFDVGVDAFDYRPVTLQEVLASRPARRGSRRSEPASG